MRKKITFLFALSFCICSLVSINVYAEKEGKSKFQGEREIIDGVVTGIDENGNVTEVSDEVGVIEDGGIAALADTSKVVNFNTSSNVTEYVEVGTGASGYTYGGYGADAAYLGTNNGKVKFMLSGVIGQVEESKVQLVDKANTKTLSHYYVSEGRLYHKITRNLANDTYLSSLDNGPAPSYLKEGIKYYSYDGHYFYLEANFADMLNDYNNGRRTCSVNASNPFYNYFQYLPLRSSSRYAGSVLDIAISNKTDSSSKMWNQGSNFVNYQNTYGVNALLMVGIAANESSWGTSRIAMEKNNLFGLNAVDASPGESANYFPNAAQCIKEFSEKWMSKEYLNPTNWKYFGGFLGNKASGINVKYASDPYWGEKAAALAWGIDNTNGKKDVYQYTIGMKDLIGPASYTVNIRNGSNTSATKLFNTPKSANCAYIILNTVPTNGFYKIQSDGVLNSSRTALDSSTGNYNFTGMYAYISSDYLTIVHKGNTGSAVLDGWNTENGNKYYYVNGKRVTGEQKIDNKWYCFATDGKMITGWHDFPNKRVYYLPSGEIAYGERYIDGKWYLFRDGNGSMVTGWHDFSNKRVYYLPTGEITYGERYIDGKWYLFRNGNGAMVTGWHDFPNKRVYYLPSGEIAYGERYIDGKWYLFRNGNGAMVTGWYDFPDKRVYYLTSGEMAFGEQKIGYKWYFFKNGNGKMLVNTWINGYYYGADGTRR